MKFVLGILASSVLFSLLASANNVQNDSSSLEIESNGNGFVLSDKEEKSSFVYTGYLNFESGQAGGLVFGAKRDEHCFVFNIDRYENKVKLLYFDGDSSIELLTDWFIGNDKMTESEKRMVEPKVKTIDQVNLKVILSKEEDHAYAEFYADGIKRFGVDETYDLNTIYEGISYEDGFLGLNVFDGRVNLSDISIGKSDYSYYSELYRNQYHFSQFSHWNNDPNGLVYYNGYYHLYFQTHPFSKYWSDMYWGHARSRDLLHWENLPICLFPDDGNMGVGLFDGYMWSGSSLVYHKGMSSLIDSYNWFGDSESGLIAFLTRDGSASQDQIIVSSDDEGMTWTKRNIIPQNISGISDRKIDFRDPKVFPVEKDGNKVVRWGMSVSSMGLNKVYFLESTDLINWTYSTSFNFNAPECLDVLTLDCDGETKDVITVCGRYYLVGKLSYTDKIVFTDENGDDISTQSLEEINSNIMDYGPDSYATQSFYIDDSSNEYFGEYVSISWFSGVPGSSRSVDSGAFAQVRHPWNGGGMTIPVKYSLARDDSTYYLAETPITKDNEKLKKTNILSKTSVDFIPSEDENPLEGVNSHIIEIDATIENPSSNDISFKVDMSSKEYLEIGWNKTEGYYVDRTHLGSAGISFSNYNERYCSNILGDEKKQTFYILSDNGGVEVFANDFKIPFYVLTLASPYSRKAEFSSSGAVTISNLVVNEISSTYRKDIASGEGMIYLSKTDINLDLALRKEETITAYCTNDDDVTFLIEEGNDIISLETNGNEAIIKPLKAGEATIKAISGEIENVCNVHVHETNDLGLPFDENGIKAGEFYQDSSSIIGENDAGDGYLLSSKTGTDFLYQAKIDLMEAKAAALIIKANSDLSRYICVNYDKSLGACKVWSNKRQLAYANIGIEDLSSILLSVRTEDSNIKVSINGTNLVDATMDDEEKEEGYFGLNVFQGKATFSSLAVTSFGFDYLDGNLTISFLSLTSLKEVINVTEKNTRIPLSYCTLNDNSLTIDETYFSTLKEKKTYKILVQSYSESYEININVKNIPLIKLQNKTVSAGENAVYFIGSRNVETITLNGVALKNDQYEVRNYCLTIYSSSLSVGENTLQLNGDEAVTITVREKEKINVFKALSALDGGYFALAMLLINPTIGLAMLAIL